MSELPRIVPAEAYERPKPTGAPGSIVQRLRERAAELSRARTLDLPVPGFRGELVLRFAPLDVPTFERLAAAQGRVSESGISETIDAMTRACVGVYAIENGQAQPLEDEDGPVRLEHRLSVLLGMAEPGSEPLTAREVVIRLFGGNAFALGTFVDKLISWMQDPDATPTPGES